MPKTKRIKGKIRRELLRVASSLFATDGYDAVSVDRIIQGAGIAKGTFYYYFKTKDDVFAEIIAEGVELFSGRVRDAIRPEESEEVKIRKLIGIEIDFFREYKDFCLVFVSEFWRYRGRWNRDIRAIQQRYMDIIEGILPDRKNMALLGPVLFWTGATMSLDWQAFRPDYPRDLLVDELSDILLNGISAAKTPSTRS